MQETEKGTQKRFKFKGIQSMEAKLKDTGINLAIRKPIVGRQFFHAS
jgi:hypothetical protein